MLQRLLGHTTLMMTNRYCRAVGCYDAVEARKRFSPVDNIKRQGGMRWLVRLLIAELISRIVLFRLT